MKLQKKNKLLKRGDFKSLLTEAHSSNRSKTIIKLGDFRVYRNLKDSPARLGINVARKVIRSSVDRNKVKRCVREFFRENREFMSGDYLFKLESPPKSLACSSLTSPLKRLLLNRRGEV